MNNFRWLCKNCGEDKLTSGAYVMRVLLKVEAELNQAEALHKNEVKFEYLVWNKDC